jgi:hypothetical protein
MNLLEEFKKINEIRDAQDHWLAGQKLADIAKEQLLKIHGLEIQIGVYKIMLDYGRPERPWRDQPKWEVK